MSKILNLIIYITLILFLTSFVSLQVLLGKSWFLLIIFYIFDFISSNSIKLDNYF